MTEVQDEPHELQTFHDSSQQNVGQVEVLSACEDQSTNTSVDTNAQPIYLKVRKIEDLSQGSHIKWIRCLGYDHHAIVTAVSEEKREVSVVQFGLTCGCAHGTCCNPNQSCRRCIRISEETLYLFTNDGSVKGCNLFKADYQGAKMSPGDVVARAKELAGDESQKSYNPLQYNCEHVARTCMAGLGISTQAQKCYAWFGKYFVFSILKLVVRVLAYFFTFVAIELKYSAGWILCGLVGLADIITFLICNPVSCKTMTCCNYRCKYYFILSGPVVTQCIFLALGCIAEYCIDLDPWDAVIGWAISVVGTYVALQFGNACEICCSANAKHVAKSDDRELQSPVEGSYEENVV